MPERKSQHMASRTHEPLARQRVLRTTFASPRQCRQRRALSPHRPDHLMHTPAKLCRRLPVLARRQSNRRATVITWAMTTTEACLGDECHVLQPAAS